jgi:alpha-1,4-N-acetylglucosaminyltransferase EXTL3
MPFKLFPSTPHDPFVPTNIKYSFKSTKSLSSLYKNKASVDPTSIGGSTGRYFLYKGLGGNYDDEQFTIIIMTYKREKLLSLELERYLKLPYLHKIIVIWNDLEVKPTNALLFKYKKSIENNRLVFIQSAKNSLNNRWLPYRQIETDAIFLVDDDAAMGNDQISFGFRAWRENRDRIVGFPSRYHSWDINQQKTTYNTRPSCEYSIILTNAFFYHRFYHFLYTHVMDYRLRNMIEKLRNCEDLAFNYMVAALTRQPPIKITAKSLFKCEICKNFSEYTGLSSNGTHYLLRADCLNEINLIYGFNSLLYSQTRLDTPLYHSGREKCFAKL